MPAKKAVLFDLGNTLIYFDGVWPEVFAKADQQLVDFLEDMGIELDRDIFTREFRERLNAYYEQRESEFIEHTTAFILRTLLSEMGHGDLSDTSLNPALEQMYAVSQAHWHIVEDTIPCLETLRELGYRLGIVSNASHDADVQKLVENANIRSYFDIVLSSAACGIRKPNPKIFEIALDKLKIGPTEAVMVGDTLGADILGARNANIFSIWCKRYAETPANRDHSDTIHPDSSIANLSELPGVLDSL
ncbi:MAG: HAD family hydrolase [Chloroflexi bacterium]|nr:HAD family hydrolase [Chloroflexota bacterium]